MTIANMNGRLRLQYASTELRILIATVSFLVLVPTVYSKAMTEDCTPVEYNETSLKCSLYTKTASCQKSNRLAPIAETLEPAVPNPPYVFMNQGCLTPSGISGVVLFWKPPNLSTLSKTRGYRVNLYYYKLNATGSVQKLDAEYCRYLKLSGNKSVNTEGVFSLTIPELIETSTTYQAEIVTLPLSNNSHSTFVNFTSYRDVAKRLDLKEGYTNNRPYSVTVSFMRSSYKESINILYNHTSYYVYLYNKDRNSLAVNLDGEQISKQEVNASKTEEFAEVTFDNLLPGTYEFRVWPQKVIYDGTCCKSCRTNIDSSQISNFFPVKVKGSEYEPRITPNLEMNKNGNVRLAFLIAPSYYHIKSYSVALVSGQNGNISLVSQTKTPEPKDEWYEAVLWFPKKDVYEVFHGEEEVYAMITPLVSEDVCEESGYCNLNGVCKPCTPSLSNTVTVLEDREPLGKASVLVISLSTSISVALVIVALVVAGFLVRRSKARNHSTSSNKLFRHQDSSASSSQSTDQEELHDSHPDGDTTTIGMHSNGLDMYIAEAPPLKLCIAYTTAPHYAPLYDDLYDILSQILTKFFNCEVINYKNIRPREAGLADCQLLIVLCSSQLFTAYNLHNMQTKPQFSRERLFSSNVLGLLVTPQPVERFIRVMLKFDHLPEKCVQELQAHPNSREVKVYSILDDLEQLAGLVCSRGVRCVNNTPVSAVTYQDFKKEGNMYTRLQEAVELIGDTYLRDQAEDCITVNTLPENEEPCPPVHPTNPQNAAPLEVDLCLKSNPHRQITLVTKDTGFWSEEGPQSSRFNSEQAKSRINTSALTTGPTQSSTQILSNFGKTSGTGCTQRLCVDEDLRPVSENCEGQSRHSTKPCGNHETEVGVVYESMGGDFAAVGGVYGAVGGVYGAVGGDLKAVGGDSIIVARDGEAQSLANLPPEGVATSPSCSQSQLSGSHDLSMSTFDSNFSQREYNF